MKTVSELVENVDARIVGSVGNLEGNVHGISIDSRNVENGWVYAALSGTQVDGHGFIEQAIEKGAIAILCSHIPQPEKENIVYIVVENVIQTLGNICGNFFDHPDRQLKLIGTTGTNGKTTVSTLLFTLFSGMGNTCGLISTVENRIGENIFPSTHTTPDIVSLYRLLDQMVEAGCDYCFMEVSSHAIHQSRIAGLEFAGALFTNITHDHLDYHGTFDNYIKAKKKFFDNLPSAAFAITNKDDKNGMVMLQNTQAAKYTYALRSSADFTVRILEGDFEGTHLQINNQDVWVGLVGEFNAYNLILVYAAAFLLTDGEDDLAVRISSLPRVSGRFETIVGPNKITAIVDYAHTPDALQNVIETINAIRKNNVRLITIVGCGGNRDAEKRPEMAKIASRLSDRVIFTSDNPRNEDPELILDQMQAGVEGQYYKKTLRITDRKEAIKAASMIAEPGDVILIAGKGHETYQEIKGIKHSFDDKKIITELFKQLI